ncbi:hypothetical protein FRB99_000170 [Tulasnella sp. 403]|nr:hypothetical protein FRB99_000170 [Tulasnella sp. 403]
MSLPPPPPYSPPSVDTLPVYSPTGGPTLTTPTNPSPAHYHYATKHLSLDLGTRLHGTSVPAYGNNAIIQGVATVHSFKYAKEVSLTIMGKASILISDRGFPVFQDIRIVLFHSVILWSSSRDGPPPSEQRKYPISFPIPSYARARTTLLPPTMTASFPGLDTEISYSIRLDMVRRRFRRHECTSTVFYYLPRSIPTSLHVLGPAFEEVEDKSEAPDQVHWKFVDVNPHPKADALHPDVIIQFGLPLPLSYTAGIPLPFRITIASPVPLTASLISSSVKIQLLKVVSLIIQRQRVRLDRTAGVGEIWKVEPCAGGGVWEITGSIGTGPLGAHVSWSLTPFLDVQYAVRLTIAPMEGLPRHRCEQLVQMVTNESQDFEMDEAREQPALGLLNQRASLCRALANE